MAAAVVDVEIQLECGPGEHVHVAEGAGGDVPGTAAPQLLGRLGGAGGGTASAEFGRERHDGAPSGCGAASGAPPSEAEMARRVSTARLVSVVSIAGSLVAASFAFSIAFWEKALPLAGFGGESMLDAVSSTLVVWRYKTPKKRQFADSQQAQQRKLERDARRERNSSLGIGLTFVVLAALLLVFAAAKLALYEPRRHAAEEKKGADYGAMLAWPSAVFFGILAWIKFRLARELESQVLHKDALCSALGALLALIVAVASLLEELASDSPAGMELVDVLAGTVIAVIILREGVVTVRGNLRDPTAHAPMA